MKAQSSAAPPPGPEGPKELHTEDDPEGPDLLTININTIMDLTEKLAHVTQAYMSQHPGMHFLEAEVAHTNVIKAIHSCRTPPPGYR